MTKYIIANWKAFDGTEIVEKFKDFKPDTSNDTKFIICPPMPLLSDLSRKNLTISLGAQDCSQHARGAFTGEVPASLLHELGVEYCLVGHSERRQHCNETEETLNQKLAQLIKADIVPIFCIGEKEEDREEAQTERVLQHQLMILAGLKPKQLIIAYEPVWAIGSSKTPTEAEIQAVYQFVEGEVEQEFTFIYGGSVSPENATSIMNIPGVDGVLVGRASTDPVKLTNMIKI